MLKRIMLAFAALFTLGCGIPSRAGVRGGLYGAGRYGAGRDRCQGHRELPCGAGLSPPLLPASLLSSLLHHGSALLSAAPLLCAALLSPAALLRSALLLEGAPYLSAVGQLGHCLSVSGPAGSFCARHALRSRVFQ